MALVTEAQKLSTQTAAPEPTQINAQTATQPASGQVRPRSSTEILEESKQGLISTLSSKDPLMALSRKKGERTAAARGLKESSFGARAAEGAAYEYAAPLVTRATELASGERTAFAGIEAQRELQAKEIESREKLAGQELESRQELQTQALTSTENQQLLDLQNKRDMQGVQLTADEEAQLRDLESRTETQTRQLAADETAQMRELQTRRDLQGEQLTAAEEAQLRDLEFRQSMLETELDASEEAQLRDLKNRRDLLGEQLSAAEDAQLRELESREGLQAQQIQADQTAQQLQLDADESRQLTDLEAKFQLQGGQLDAQEAAQLRELQLRRDMQANDLLGQAWLKAYDAVTQKEIQQKEIDFKLKSQSIDILYKGWLENTTFGHEMTLQSNKQAADAYTNYLDKSTAILNNPETSAAQKGAALKGLKEGFRDNLVLIEGVSNVDLTGLLPATIRTTTGGNAGGTSPSGGLTSADIKKITQLNTERARLQQRIKDRSYAAPGKGAQHPSLGKDRLRVEAIDAELVGYA